MKAVYSEVTLKPQERLQLIREWFRSGQYGKATLALEKMSLEKSLSPETRIECAEIAKRTGNTPLAVKILSSRVRPFLESHPGTSSGQQTPKRTRKTSTHATPAELMSYAVAAGLLGAQGESNHAFDIISEEEFPEVSLHRGIAALGKWDYDQAIRELEKFLQSPASQKEEDRWTALTRLAMAKIRCARPELKASESILTELLKDPATPTPHRMWAWQIQAELHYLQGDWKATLREVEALMYRHPEHRSPGLVFWKSFLSIRHGIGNLRAHEEAVQKECQLALQEGYGYITRIADLHRAFILKDSRALTRLCYGSPFPFLRDYAFRRFGEKFTLPEEHTYSVQIPATNVTWDLYSGVLLDHQGSAQKPSSQSLALARILSLEAYQAVSAAEIHENLFPGKWPWDALASQRVQMAISRLRTWCKEVDPSLTDLAIETQDEGRTYRWSRSFPWKIVIRKALLAKEAVAQKSEKGAEIALQSQIESAFKKFGSQSDFSTSDLASHFDISLRSAVTRVKVWIEKGHLEVTGKGRATRYRLKKI